MTLHSLLYQSGYFYYRKRKSLLVFKKLLFIEKNSLLIFMIAFLIPLIIGIFEPSFIVIAMANLLLMHTIYENTSKKCLTIDKNLKTDIVEFFRQEENILLLHVALKESVFKTSESRSIDTEASISRLMALRGSADFEREILGSLEAWHEIENKNNEEIDSFFLKAKTSYEEYL